MGGWMKGGRYGLYASGDRFGLFTRGNAFTSGYQAFPQTVGGRTALTYAVASPTVDVMLHGTATLPIGRAEVEFPAEALAVLSETEPVAVFLSPADPAVPLAVAAASPRGFAVTAPNGRSSSVSFAWIAVGRRKGFERVEPPAEVLAADFESNMERVAFDENDREGSGLGLYYDDALRFGVPPGARAAAEKGAPPAPAPDRRPAAAVGPGPAAPGPATPPVGPPEAPTHLPAPSAVPSLQVPYPAGESVEPGDVLVMSPADERGLYKCIRAADPMVVGVAGELPAAGAGEVPVVLAGIAVVKADATLRPIARGDLLVTAPNPGHAMGAPAPAGPGTVVGKALDSLETGTGTIRILVMAK
jgi:hypothetical protein